MKRGGRVRGRSRKQVSAYVERRELVGSLLEQRPWCEIRWDARCTERAIDVDEIQARSAGGSFLDPDNCQTTCRHCHQQKHANPAEAIARGFTRPSWSST